MAPTPQEALALAALLSKKIKDRRPEIARHVAYYKGREGRMRFASDEFRDYFEKRFAGFTDNWCMPVAQAPIERIGFLGIRLPGATSADRSLAEMWERNDANRGLNEALLMMSIAKRSFALVSPTPGKRARITFEHPDSAAVIYDPITRARLAGMTIWQDDTTEYAELHLPASILRLQRGKVAVSNGDRYVPPDADGWEFARDESVESPNPLGEVGLVELRNGALLDDDPASDISGVEAMQDSINLIWAYLLNALDYASLPGRVVMNGEVPRVPILDDNGVETGDTKPLELDTLIRDRVAFLPGDKVTIGEWTAANLDVFSKVIEHAVEHVAAQTRTPGHYLLNGSNVPATGYETAEAGLTSKANERISYATPEVREIHRLGAIAEDNTVLAEQVALSKPLWRKTQFRSEVQLMDGLVKMRSAGFPFQWIAEEYGLSPDEVDRVMEMVRAEQTDPYLTALDAKAAAGGTPASAPAVG